MFDGSRPVTPTLANLASVSKSILPLVKLSNTMRLPTGAVTGNRRLSCRGELDHKTHRRTHCITTHTNECCSPPASSGRRHRRRPWWFTNNALANCHRCWRCANGKTRPTGKLKVVQKTGRLNQELFSYGRNSGERLRSLLPLPSRCDRNGARL
jgi:hypothetical protein